MAVTDALLQVRDLTVRFGPVTAVDGIDLDVDEGEVLAVLGPSGSGKSTLLRAVAGLQPLDAGTVHLAGRPLDGVPPHRRQVGLMFQDHALFPHRDVAGNVGFGPRMARVPPAEAAERVRALLALVELEGYDRRPIHTLSGGEQQRVALARALAAQPRLLLLDEPFGALDRPLRERLAADVRRIAGQLGLTVVAVTHDHREAFAIADRVAVLDRGRLLQRDTPAAVWRRPASRRVAEVLGLPNVVPVPVHGGRGSTPWGPVPIEAPDGESCIHLPIPALHLAGAADEPAVTGVVAGTAFQGDRTLIRVALADGTEVQVAAPLDGPVPGQEVRVAADLDQIVPLPT
ncbi:MAG TPA: ABC transporter ATP-binding protein [Acidimicrobiales bacterium]|nr:ABC transporter ATP-binding protein [Acidimicrobiales bacterium]